MPIHMIRPFRKPTEWDLVADKLYNECFSALVDYQHFCDKLYLRAVQEESIHEDDVKISRTLGQRYENRRANLENYLITNRKGFRYPHYCPKLSRYEIINRAEENAKLSIDNLH